MNKLQKGILILICIILFIIIVILITLSNNTNKTIDNINKNVISNDNETNNNVVNNSIIDDERNGEIAYEGSEVSNDVKKIKSLEDKNTYFTLDALCQNYINLVANECKEELMNVVSSRYIKEYNINESNILDIIEIPKMTNINQYYKIVILDILTVRIDQKTSLYIVKGKGRLVGNSDVFEYNIMIEVDNNQSVYSIYPSQYLKDKGYDKLVQGNQINYTANNIIKNKDNEFMHTLKDDLEMAKEYFNNYTEMLAYYKQDAYNKLNFQYMKEKFGSEQNFYNYLEEIKYIIYTMQINKYKVYHTKYYTDYVCTDQYENHYIFRQKNGIMDYTVFMDSYTVDLDTYKENYNNGNEVNKVKMQIEKFNQMLNTKDYNAIYNKLNSVFKQNNFNNVSNLKEYLQKNSYEINDIEIDDSYLNEDYYICECTLRNSKNTNEDKKINIIIKLIDYNNFEMSFSFEQ